MQLVRWALLLLSLALAARELGLAATPEQTSILAGRGLAGVELGMPPAKLRALLGEPVRIEGEGWHYPQLHLAVFVKAGAVHRIFLGEPCDGVKDPFGSTLPAAEKLSTPDGLKLGSPLDAVLAGQGAPDRRSSAGGVEHLVYLRKGIEFGVGERGVCIVVIRPPHPV